MDIKIITIEARKQYIAVIHCTALYVTQFLHKWLIMDIRLIPDSLFRSIPYLMHQSFLHFTC